MQCEIYITRTCKNKAQLNRYDYFLADLYNYFFYMYVCVHVCSIVPGPVPEVCIVYECIHTDMIPRSVIFLFF